MVNGDNSVEEVTIVRATDNATELDDWYKVQVRTSNCETPKLSPKFELCEDPNDVDGDGVTVRTVVPLGLPIALLRQFTVHGNKLRVPTERVSGIEAESMFAYDAASGTLTVNDGNHRINTAATSCALVHDGVFSLNRNHGSMGGRENGGQKIVADEDDRVLTATLLHMLQCDGQRGAACFSPRVALACYEARCSRTQD